SDGTARPPASTSRCPGVRQSSHAVQTRAPRARRRSVQPVREIPAGIPRGFCAVCRMESCRCGLAEQHGRNNEGRPNVKRIKDKGTGIREGRKKSIFSSRDLAFFLPTILYPLSLIHVFLPPFRHTPLASPQRSSL